MPRLTDAERKPTRAMAAAARKGLRLRAEHGRGGTAVGVARARDLQNRVTLSEDTILRMHSYFARHAVDAQAPGWESETDPSAGWIAWLLWGGDAGRDWARVRRDKIKAPKRRTLRLRRGIVTRAARRSRSPSARQAQRLFRSALRSSEAVMARAWSKALTAQRDRIIARLADLDAARGVQSRMLPLTPGAPRVQRVILIDDVLGLFTAAREAIILAEAVTGIVESVVQIGWGLFKDWLGGIKYDPTMSPAQKLLAEQVTRVTETTKRQIEAEVYAGIQAGESLSQIQERIRSSQAFSPARALTIARTEAARALNAGSLQAYNDAANLGIDVQIEWLRAPRVLEPDRSHRRCHGQKVAPGGLFVIPSGEDVGASAPAPGGFNIARQDINCRCSTRPVIED